MKTLWNAVCVVAVANLLAVGAFVGWLRMTDRLDADRLRSVRELMAPTIAQTKAAEEEKKKAEEAEKAKAEAEVKAGKAPLTAAEQLAARIEATELDRQRFERLKREVEDLQRALSSERADLDSRRAKLTSDIKAYNEMLASSAGKVQDAQFKKTLGVLEALKPAEAKAVLVQILATKDAEPAFAPVGPELTANGVVPAASPGGANTAVGPGAGPDRRMNEVVAYLDSMQDDVRTKIIAQFVKSDPQLAAVLLERLRERGRLARNP